MGAMGKGLVLIATVAVLGVAFLAGRKSFGVTSPYDHAEVVDALTEKCEEGTFINGCSPCKECERYEYAAGGCSYFQDTFCVLCTEIPHCQQDNIICTSKFDHTCTQCDTGYWDVTCKPCTICPNNFYADTPCSQDQDTVCKPCSSCNEEEFVERTCQYASEVAGTEDGDTICTPCTVCSVGTFTYEKCQNMGSYVDGNKIEQDAVYTVTADTVCKDCTVCDEGTFVEETCTIEVDTTCTTCTSCEDGLYIGELCEVGEPLVNGKDSVCKDCSTKPLGVTHWEVFHCGGTSDALFKECSICQKGEYQKEACSETSDSVCPDCDAINHCADGKIVCTSPEDEVCEECEVDFYNADCCYQKTYQDCGTPSSRERIAARFGFDIRADDASNEKFIETCMMLCDEMPDCMAFEVIDGDDGTLEASGSNDFVSKTATCFFKGSYTKRPKGRVDMDCYSNVCRQGVDRIEW